MEIDIPEYNLHVLSREIEERIEEWEKERDKPYIKKTRREAIQKKIDQLRIIAEALSFEL